MSKILSVLACKQVILHMLDMRKPRAAKFVLGVSTIRSLLDGIESGNIGIPLMQRPFVWSKKQVLELIDSLYRGYPVGYLISWTGTDTLLKNHTSSMDKMVIIDGQQRMKAIGAALLGQELFDDDYLKLRIQISFNPIDEKFRLVASSKTPDSSWIDDIAAFFKEEAKFDSLLNSYCSVNPREDRESIKANLERLANIADTEVGIVTLSNALDLHEATDIFMRINYAGVRLNHSDFVMARLSSDDKFGGRELQKGIESFAKHIAQANAKSNASIDQTIATTQYSEQMMWALTANRCTYVPSVEDIIAVAISFDATLVDVKEIQNLLAKAKSDIKRTHAKLDVAIMNIMDESNFRSFNLLLHDAGFISRKLVRDVQNELNLAYGLFLAFQKAHANDMEKFCQSIKCLFLTTILARETAAPANLVHERRGPSHGQFTLNRRNRRKLNLEPFANAITATSLPVSFWNDTLPRFYRSYRCHSSPSILNIFIACQIAMEDMVFLSKNTSIRSLIEFEYTQHHIYPLGFLKSMEKGSIYPPDCAANLVVLDKSTNEKISDSSPEAYFGQLKRQCKDREAIYGDITDLAELKENFAQHCIPFGLDELSYDEFIEERSKLMAAKIRIYFENL